MRNRKICIVTGTRAEYGQLYWLLKDIKSDPVLDLQIIVTGTHLSPEFDLTFTEIESDGFQIDKKIEMLLSADTAAAISKSTALGLIGFADALDSLSPDLIVLLGDRYEMLAAAISSFFANIPIVHLCGGETTTGAADESIRHAITKFSWYHLTSAEEYSKRVLQLGEHPNYDFTVGSLGVDSIRRTSFLDKKELCRQTGIKFGLKNLLITYHSVTLEKKSSEKSFEILLSALNNLNDTQLIFTAPNADKDGRIIIKMIEDFVSDRQGQAFFIPSLGRIKYLSTLQYIDGVVGNSSSGLTEVPSFKIGTVNIGDRQMGRLRSESVIDCKIDTKSILDSIAQLYSATFKEVIKNAHNPYGDGYTSGRILNILKTQPLPTNLKKEFVSV